MGRRFETGDDDRLITLHDTCEMCGFSKRSYYRKRLELPKPIRTGGRLMFSLKEVREYIKGLLDDR